MRKRQLLTVLVLVLLVGVVPAALARSGPTAESSRSAKKIARKALRKARQAKRAVADVPAGPQGERGPKGDKGDKGDPGAAGSARAYGRVSHLGVLSRSKGIAGVNIAYNGGYCIVPAAGSGLDPASDVLIATVDASDSTTSTSSEVMAHVEWDRSADNCPAGQYEVMTTEAYVQLSTDDVRPEPQAFSFVIP